MRTSKEKVAGISETKLQIQDRLLEMMATQDIHNIKVKALTDSLSISRSTFYLYYDSVYDVLQELEDEFFEQLQTAALKFWQYPLSARYLKEAHPAFLKLFQIIKENRKLSIILWGPHGDPTFQTKCKIMIQKNLLPPAIAKSLYPDNTDLILMYKVGGHLEMINYWWGHIDEISVEQMAIINYRMLYMDVV